jgi:hypothetical protein
MLSIVFTVVFAATGGYALYRLAAQASGADPGVDRTVELAHLLMSVAMIAMVWGWTGGPATASGIVQLVVFGLFAIWFLAGAVAGSATAGLHLVAAAAMVWMVGAMPLLMGVPDPSDAESGMAGMPGMGDSAIPMPSMEPNAPPAWAVSLTVLFALLLVLTAALWTRYALAGPRRGESSAAGAEAVEPVGSRAGRHAAALVIAPRRVTMTRLDAFCHALMGMGMAAVLAAML